MPMIFVSYLFPETCFSCHLFSRDISLSSAVKSLAAASLQKMYKYLLYHILPEQVCIHLRSLGGIFHKWSLNMWLLITSMNEMYLLKTGAWTSLCDCSASSLMLWFCVLHYMITIPIIHIWLHHLFLSTGWPSKCYHENKKLLNTLIPSHLFLSRFGSSQISERYSPLMKID